MRARLAMAPPWVAGVIAGVLFGAGMAVWALVSDDRDGGWVGWAVAGVLAGLFFGTGMTFAFRSENRRAQEQLLPLSPEQRGEALRAAGRGPAPADPAVRAVALRLVRQRQALALRQRTGGIVVFALIAALDVWLALTRSPWWWLAFAMFAAALVAQVTQPRRLDRRVAVLSS